MILCLHAERNDINFMNDAGLYVLRQIFCRRSC